MKVESFRNFRRICKSAVSTSYVDGVWLTVDTFTQQLRSFLRCHGNTCSETPSHFVCQIRYRL
jgi:hypothetical protein